MDTISAQALQTTAEAVLALDNINKATARPLLTTIINKYVKILENNREWGGGFRNSDFCKLF